MNLLNELDKLYKVKEQKAQKSSLDVKLQVELHHLDLRKEMIKAENTLLLERCLILQNGIKLFDYFRNLI
jgi:hypothetical protein